MTETNQKSDRIKNIIELRLSKYFKPEQLDPLTEPELDILADYFSNQQYRQMKNAPAEFIKGLVSRHVKTVERQRLSNIPEEELESSLEYYKTIADEVEEVICQKCNKTIAIEIKHSKYDSVQYFGNPNLHWQGRFIIAVGNRLHGYRRRHDDVMGYRCGNFIENPDYIKEMADWEKECKNIEAKNEKLKKGETAQPLPAQPDHKHHLPKQLPCGNESTMSEPELAAIPEDHLEQRVVTQADIQRVKQHINKTNYQKPVKKVKDGYVLDGKFKLRKVK